MQAAIVPAITQAESDGFRHTITKCKLLSVCIAMCREVTGLVKNYKLGAQLLSYHRAYEQFIECISVLQFEQVFDPKALLPARRRRPIGPSLTEKL